MDCEVIAYDNQKGKSLPFNYLQKLKDDNSEILGKHPFKVIIFDLLLIDEVGLLKSGYQTRRSKLDSFVCTDFISVIQSKDLELTSREEIMATLESQYQQARNAGNEGLVIKRTDDKSTYIPGTRKLWYKLKYLDASRKESLDLIVMAGYWGQVS